MATTDPAPLTVLEARPVESAGGLDTERFLAGLLALRAEEADVGEVLDRLAPLARETFGGHVVDLSLTDSRSARLVGGGTAHGPLADVVKRWRRTPARRPERVGDLVVVPLTDGERLVGALRLRVDVPVEDALLRLLGARVGEVVARLVETARRADADAVADGLAHRERIAREVPEVVTLHLAPAGPALDDLAAMVLPPEAAARVVTARNAVARAATEAAQSAAVLDLLGGQRRGLVPSLRAVARELSADRYAAVELRTTGRVRDVEPVAAEALFRVARIAAISSIRHGRATLVTITVTYAVDRVAVVVRDDGAGLAARSDGETGLVFGLRLLRRRLEELHGGLEITHGRRTGVVVHAWAGVRE